MAEATARFSVVTDAMLSGFESGTLVGAYRWPDGEMISIALKHWNGDRTEERLRSFQFSPSHPFPAKGVISEDRVWIFVTKESLEAFLAPTQTDQRHATAPAKPSTRRRDWNVADEVHFKKIARLITEGKKLSVRAAATEVAEDAPGNSPDSTRDRIAKGYRLWAPLQDPPAPVP